MNELPDEDLMAVVNAMGKALDLPIRDDNAQAVAAHLRIAFRMAAALEDCALPDDAEPAPVYTA